MINDKDEIVQWYFDMVKNVGNESDIPYIDDLYLDLVVKKDGKTLLLDENELQDALDIADITQEDFDTAYKTANELISKYENNTTELYNFTHKYFEMF